MLKEGSSALTVRKRSGWIEVEKPHLFCSEAEFQNAVNKLAAKNGWLIYHTHNSKRSQPGFPDLGIVRGEEVIFAELKRERNAKMTVAQERWIDALSDVSSIGVYLWRPSDWEEIVECIT